MPASRALPRRGQQDRPGTRCGYLLAGFFAVGLMSAPAHAAVDSDPVDFITAIYKTYTDIDTSDPNTGDMPMPGLPNMYSKRLQDLVDKDERDTPEGEVGRIDWDVFVDGQDWQLTELKITLVSKSEDKAQIRSTFKNFDDAENMLFDMVREDGHWRIDDIEKTIPPRWTMSKILMDAPDAFPDDKPAQ
jgi:hypothetical protein